MEVFRIWEQLQTSHPSLMDLQETMLNSLVLRRTLYLLILWSKPKILVNNHHLFLTILLKWVWNDSTTRAHSHKQQMSNLELRLILEEIQSFKLILICSGVNLCQRKHNFKEMRSNSLRFNQTNKLEDLFSLRITYLQMLAILLMMSKRCTAIQWKWANL